MRVDADGRLRHRNWPGKGRELYLGDVGDALLRAFGPHEPPECLEEMGHDEQRWTLRFGDAECEVEVTSRAYWGFGLFARCFANEIRVRGDARRIGRLVFDLSASLGRNPWEASRPGRFAKWSGVEGAEQTARWQTWMDKGASDLADAIDAMRTRATELGGDLDRLADDAPPGWSQSLAEDGIEGALAQLDMARDALHDRSAAAVERALARAEAALIEADPRTEVAAQHLEDVLAELGVEAEEVDLSEVVRTHETLPQDARESEEDIPFVDLSEEE